MKKSKLDYIRLSIFALVAVVIFTVIFRRVESRKKIEQMVNVKSSEIVVSSPAQEPMKHEIHLGTPEPISKSVSASLINRKKKFLTNAEIARLNPILKNYGVAFKNVSKSHVKEFLQSRTQNTVGLDYILKSLPPGDILTVLNSDMDKPYLHFAHLRTVCPQLNFLDGQVVMKIFDNHIVGGVFTKTGEPIPNNYANCTVVDPHKTYPAGFTTIFSPNGNPLTRTVASESK